MVDKADIAKVIELAESKDEDEARQAVELWLKLIQNDKDKLQK